MTRLINFIKTTAVGGLLVIIPVSIILFVLAQLFYGLYKVSNELIRTLGLHTPNDALLIVGITVAALIGLCFVTGRARANPPGSCGYGLVQASRRESHPNVQRAQQSDEAIRRW